MAPFAKPGVENMVASSSEDPFSGERISSAIWLQAMVENNMNSADIFIYIFITNLFLLLIEFYNCLKI